MTEQKWAGVDGVTAFHLIERHALDWEDIAMMMGAWHRANASEEAKEGVKILDNLIAGISKHGNYSASATLLFLGQARQCFDALAPPVQVLRDNLALAERDSLRAFAQAVMECWPMGDLLDGGTLQDVAVAHGLLKSEIRHEPCGEGCACAQYADAKEFDSGVECYRKTPLLKGPNA